MSYIHPLAAIELEDATIHYNQISSGLAERFLNDYELTLSFVEAMPGTWAIYFSGFRKLNFKTFPYAIIYYWEKGSEQLTVIAIQHQSKKPFYWKDRI